MLALALALALIGCGADPGPGTRADGGAWLTQPVGSGTVTVADHSGQPDRPPLFATSGDDALVLGVSADGTLRSYLSTDGGDFVAGTPFATVGSEFAAGTPLAVEVDSADIFDLVALPGGGWLVLGLGRATFDGGGSTMIALGLRSTDGLTWEWSQVPGLPVPMTVSDVAVVDGTVVVAGSTPSAMSPRDSHAEPRLWTSTDGETFTEAVAPGATDAPTPPGSAYVVRLAVADDRLVAAGTAAGPVTVWTSDDVGRSWTPTADATLAPGTWLTGLAVAGDVALVVGGQVPGGSAVAPGALLSSDGAATWTTAGPSSAGEPVAWAGVWSAGGRLWARAGIDHATVSRPEVCYADIAQCDPTHPRVATSTDGVTWTTVDLPGTADQVAATADGRVLVLGTDEGRTVIRTLPSGTPPPEGPAPSPIRTTELVTLEDGQAPEVGVRYHAPLPIYCGMDGWVFGDAEWVRTDDGPEVEINDLADPPIRTPVPQGWPVAGTTLYGYATLTEDGVLEYSVDDEVVATYRRGDSSWCD